MSKEFRVRILEGLIVVACIVFFSYFAIEGMNDLRDVGKVEQIQQDLKELRTALEKYYEKTGTYPNLLQEGAKDNLSILDYENARGEKISFAEIYGKNSLPKTAGTKLLPASNSIYDISDFNQGNNQGGWNYNYSQFTGEIHANIAEDTFMQKIDWKRQ